MSEKKFIMIRCLFLKLIFGQNTSESKRLREFLFEKYYSPCPDSRFKCGKSRTNTSDDSYEKQYLGYSYAKQPI